MTWIQSGCASLGGAFAQNTGANAVDRTLGHPSATVAAAMPPSLEWSTAHVFVPWTGSITLVRLSLNSK